MAVTIKQYQQQTSPSGPGVVPHARATMLDDSAQVAGMRLAGALSGAAEQIARVNEAAAEERRQQEAEDAKVWTAHAVAKAQQDMAQSFIESQDAAQPGAPNFTRDYGTLFDSYTEDALANAPNEVSKKFLAEGMLRLRADMTGKAMEYEVGERRKWRVDTGKQAIDAVAATMAADPSRLPVVLAEQHAMIDSYAVPQEAKRAMHAYLDEQVATAAVLGDIERNPEVARVQLATRLGVDVTQVAGPGASADMVWQRMLGRESGNRQFGADGSPLTSIKGAVGVAQVMPETGPEAARYANLPWDPERFRADADYNAALGRAYYDEQLRKYQTPALAAAAYNAGPGAVDEWIARFGDPRKGEISVAEFAAKIPFKETREYVAAVAAPGPSVAQAATEKPEGERTGSTAYDLLTVPQVVQLLSRANQETEKQGAQFREYVSAREADDLAAYGDGQQPPNPLEVGEFVAAYGEVDGLRRWEAYQHAQNYATDVASFASKTDDEIAALVTERAPVPGEGYAAAKKAHDARVQAAVATATARRADPVQFAMDNGLTHVQPLDFQNPEAMAAGLKARVGTASMMSDLYGTGYTLLTKAEAAQMGGMLGGMTAPEKAQFLQGVRGALPDARSYTAIMAVLRPDSPVTATAGSILGVGSSNAIARGTKSADAVAQRLLVGEDLLNPPKGASGTDGKPKFAMPPEADLRQVWTDYTGTAYAGFPDTENAAYQSFRAYYAAELAAAGDYTGTFNQDAAERAAEAVTGGVVEVNDSTIVLPWGQGERYVLDSLRRGWEAQRAGAGLPSVPFEQVSLQTVGDGAYAVTAGTGPIRGADGQPMILRVQRLYSSEMPQVPTGP